MVNSTLGGLIKDYRLQKGISQQDIAFALGWKETSRLSRIEQGRTERPTREILERIIAAIGLEEEEKNTLLLTAGFLPTEEEILVIKKEIKPILDQWQYPAIIIDFTWRLIEHNNQFIKVAQLPKQLEENIYKSELRVLDMLFNNPLESMLDDLSERNEHRIFLTNVVLNFKHEQRSRTKEKWYIDHIRRLMDSKLFRELWVEVHQMKERTGVLGKYTIKKLVSSENKILSFYIFIVPVIKDPRFEVELFIPMNLETYNHFHKL